MNENQEQGYKDAISMLRAELAAQSESIMRAALAVPAEYMRETMAETIAALVAENAELRRQLAAERDRMPWLNET